MFEDLGEGFIAFLHLGIVGLHVAEFSHAAQLSITVLIGGGYTVLSLIEFNHARKHIAERHHQNRARGQEYKDAA